MMNMFFLISLLIIGGCPNIIMKWEGGDILFEIIQLLNRTY